MKIKNLTLHTNQLEEEKKFYHQILGFPFLSVDSDSFSVQVGYTKLTFQKSIHHYKYHYCFLIPSNQLQESIVWLQKRLNIVEIESGRIIQRFETWNADSIYFYDGSGNLAEFIVRYDLKNETETPFELSNILCVNEIGMPIKNVEKINAQIEHELESMFWKGDKLRFGTNGTQDGLFLLPNYEMKTTWFPTDLKVEPSPFSAIISHKNKEYNVEFENEELTTTLKVD